MSRTPYPRPTGPDPYQPGSDGYAERHQETVTQLPGGLVRIDLGEPIGPAKPKRQPRPAPAEPLLEPAEAPPAHPQRPSGPKWSPEARAAFRLSNALDG